MSDETLQTERDRLEAELAKLKAKFEAAEEERDRLLIENDQLMAAALFAAKHGDLFVAYYHDCIRRACEETDVDAASLIQKLPPFTLDFLTPAGAARYVKKLFETLTDEEFRVCRHAKEIALESFWRNIKARSSHA
jgi:hypothetical protein